MSRTCRTTPPPAPRRQRSLPQRVHVHASGGWSMTRRARRTAPGATPGHPAARADPGPAAVLLQLAEPVRRGRQRGLPELCPAAGSAPRPGRSARRSESAAPQPSLLRLYHGDLSPHHRTSSSTCESSSTRQRRIIEHSTLTPSPSPGCNVTPVTQATPEWLRFDGGVGENEPLTMKSAGKQPVRPVENILRPCGKVVDKVAADLRDNRYRNVICERAGNPGSWRLGCRWRPLA